MMLLSYDAAMVLRIFMSHNRLHSRNSAANKLVEYGILCRIELADAPDEYYVVGEGE